MPKGSPRRKQRAKMSGGNFIARLGGDFKVVTEESLLAWTMVVCELTTIDMDKLVRLHIFESMTQLMDASGVRYQEFDGSFVGSSQVPYQRRSVRYMTDGVGTSAAPQTQPQLDP
nr:hypothetical protein [Tanacetum cinerariifolium]